jgi:3-methyladenine DNA glycosylase AlkC
MKAKRESVLKTDPEFNESALKHQFNANLLKRLAAALSPHFPKLDAKKLILISSALEKLEMKPRVHLIRDELKTVLPDHYPDALKILVKTLKDGKLEGFAVWPIAEFIQTYGTDHALISLEALKILTTHFTSEWAVRPFILKHQTQTMKFLLECSKHKNVDVRRWASEGSRPRLPWGERLQEFVKDPKPTRAILENLKFDSELFVRKSVSNHLNDISKDHPEYVIQLLKEWQKKAKGEDEKKVEWIIHRSLRTMIKNGHPAALELIGVSHGAAVELVGFKLEPKIVKMGERLNFEIELKSTSKKSQKLVIDYLMHFVKSNGGTTAKVFKLRAVEISAGSRVHIKKSHSLKKITTRVYFPGEQFLEIQVNGKVLAKKKWLLK